MKFIQLKHEVHDSYEKDEKIATDLQPNINEDVINKAYLDGKLLKINGHLSILEKDSKEFKRQYNKQSIEEILVRRAVKTTIQTLYDKGLFNGFPDADKGIKEFLFVTRCRPDLEKINEDTI